MSDDPNQNQLNSASNGSVSPSNPLEDLGSKPVIFEPAPLPGERPNVAPANVPHDAPPPPLPKKHHEPSPLTTPTPPDPTAIGGVPYQPKTTSTPGSTPVASATQSSSPVTSVLARVKKPLIIGGIILAVLLLGSIILKATTKKSSNSNNSSQQETNQNGGPTATAPEGYKVIDRPCFSFAMLDTNLSVGLDNICFVIARYGEKGISSLNVYPETKTYSSIDEFSAAKKKEYNSRVVSEENTKIDGIDAKKVIETVGPNGQQYVRYYVLTPGKNYKYQQTAITGFEINSFYNDDFSRQVTGKTIESWKWK